MEAITQLVAESLARHGFDRPVDPRRLQWSRWFPCDSPHSLLVVPSKPGIFAIAEEIVGNVARAPSPAASAAEAPQRRMLAVLQFSEDDDMAFTLDRMFTRINPMRARLATGRCFVRFVVIEDQTQRRSICAALNQWMLSSAEKASGLPADFQSSLELTPDRVGRTLLSANAGTNPAPAQGTQLDRETDASHSAPHPDSGANKNLHCPHPLPSGF
ncbi:MAG: hypothetical protein ABSA78_06080 [Candidatus Sulfotelmatobacter sp.]|jgi:hypothetical protein